MNLFKRIFHFHHWHEVEIERREFCGAVTKKKEDQCCQCGKIRVEGYGT